MKAEVWKAPRTVAAWQAVGSEVVHDEAVTEEGQVTRALREAIKELVSAHGAGPQAGRWPLCVGCQVDELMRVAEDVEQMEKDRASLQLRWAKFRELAQMQSRSAQEQLRMAQENARLGLRDRAELLAGKASSYGAWPPVGV